MDKQFFMRKVVTQLGLPALSLEKYYPLIDEVLTKDTLPTFSQYFPYIYTFKMDLSTIPYTEGEGTSRIYYIRDKFLNDNNLEILSVTSVTGTSYYTDWNSAPFTFNVEAMLLEGVASGIRSQLNLSTKSFNFLPPNRLKLRGYSGSESLWITVKIPYPNFGAISPSVSVELERLAKCDIKMWLYPELRMYDHLTLPDGEVSLHIDDWEGAEKEREDIINDWRNKNFPNSIQYRPYHYE